MKMNRTLMGFVALIAFISGCVIEPMAPSDFPYELMLQPSDLPQGFVRTGGTFPETPGAFVHIVGYAIDPDQIGVGISHQVAIYPDLESAKTAFSIREDEVFTDVWLEPSNTYIPLNTDDRSALKCMDVQVDDKISQSCRFLQQHNNLVVLVLANIDSEAIDFQQFLDMLQKLDSRLPSESVPMPKQ